MNQNQIAKIAGITLKHPLMNFMREISLAGNCRSSFNKLRKLGVFKPLPYLRRNQIYPFEQLLAYISQAAPKPLGK